MQEKEHKDDRTSFAKATYATHLGTEMSTMGTQAIQSWLAPTLCLGACGERAALIDSLMTLQLWTLRSFALMAMIGVLQLWTLSWRISGRRFFRRTRRRTTCSSG